MVYVIIAIHAIVCIGLILAILLHSGKGAGVSTMFGGGMPSSFSGTSMIEKNLDRITIGLAVTFAITTFVLMLTMPKELTVAPPQQQTPTSTPTGPGTKSPAGQPTQGSPTAPTPSQPATGGK